MWSPQSRLAVDFFPGLPFPNSPRSPRLRVRFVFLLEGSRDPRRRADGWHLPGIGITRRRGAFHRQPGRIPLLNGTHSSGEEVDSDQVFGTPLIPIIQIARRKRISQVAGPICEVCPTIPARTDSASCGSKSEETLSCPSDLSREIIRPS